MNSMSFIADAAVDVCEIESRLRLELDRPADVPRIESLFELESLCDAGKADAPFWQCVAVGAASSICLEFPQLIYFAPEAIGHMSAIAALKARRYS